MAHYLVSLQDHEPVVIVAFSADDAQDTAEHRYNAPATSVEPLYC